MLPRMRCLSLLAVVSLLALPLYAQIHGVPSSVTSFGFGGNISPAPGVPASVTSLGPNGFNFIPPVNGPCCFNTFFPGHQFSSQPGDQFPALNFRSFHQRNHFGPSFFPAYSSSYVYAYPVMVPVPYANDEGDEGYAVEDMQPSSRFDRQHLRSRRDDTGEVSVTVKPAPSAGEQTVTAQPSTVLIFKDGHKVDVENYAIVGETLFEFQDGFTHKIQLADLDLPATQKANDDRGVEFHAPSASGQ